MRCVDCEKHKFEFNTHWCKASNRPKRVREEDVYKDVPCKHGKLKGADDYERAIEQMEHDMLYEPTYNSEDGSM